MMIDKDRITKNKMDITSIFNQVDSLVKQEKDMFFADVKNSQALKYLLIEAVESIVDICQHVLAKTKGIPCEGYVDCIVKAGKEGIISLSLANKLRRLADLRNSLIHRYWVIDDAKLYLLTLTNKEDLKEFIQEIDKFTMQCL